jgi:uncharacterized membrane protein
MKLKILVGLLVFLVVLNLAALGTFMVGHFSRPPRPPLHGLHGDSAERGSRGGERPWLRRLPHKERDELFNLLQEFQRETHDLRVRAHSLEGEAFGLMQRDPVPTARVDSLLAEISTARLEISRIAARKLIEAKTVLRPEQQRMFFDAILGARPVPREVRGPLRGERHLRDRGGRADSDTLEPPMDMDGSSPPPPPLDD